MHLASLAQVISRENNKGAAKSESWSAPLLFACNNVSPQCPFYHKSKQEEIKNSSIDLRFE